MFAAAVCMRSETIILIRHSVRTIRRYEDVLVKTNCPTVAPKPERKALKGCDEALAPNQSSYQKASPSSSPATYVIAGQDAVEKLQCAHNGNESEEHVNELRPLWRFVHVILVDVLQHLVPIRRGVLGQRR